MKNVFYNKGQINPKEQSRIDNPEELPILRTQDKHNKQKQQQNTENLKDE